MSIKARFAQLWYPEDVLDSLWSLFASPQATMLLLLALAGLVCLGTLLPQKPAQAVANPAAHSLWLTSVLERYHAAAGWLLSLGLLDIRRSYWFRGLLGLLAFNLMLGTVDLIHVRRLGRAEWPHGDNALAGMLSPGETAEQFVERVKMALRMQHFRVLKSDGSRLLYADRFALFPVLVYLGLLLIIMGLALSERTAWWEEGLALRPGQVHLLGHGTDLALRTAVIPADGSAKQDASSLAEQDASARARQEAMEASKGGQLPNESVALTFLRGEQEVARVMLYKRAPSFYAGLILYLASTEPALLVQGYDETGQSLALQTPETGATQFTEVALRFREDTTPRYIIMLNLAPSGTTGRYFQQKGNEQYVVVPQRNLSLHLVYNPPPPGQVVPTFLVEAMRNGQETPFYHQQFQGEDSLEVAGDRYTFRLSYYAIIKVGRDYGLALVSTGAVTLLAGVILSIWRAPRRLWLVARVANGAVKLELVTDKAIQTDPPSWLKSLVQDLMTALALRAEGALGE